MERGKTGTGRGSKNKIAPHPSDFIALGSKNSRGDLPDPKRPGVNLPKPPPSSSTVIINDRKKEGSALQSLIPAKKPKLAPHTAAPPPRAPVSYTEVWEGVAIDCDPADLVPLVLEANDNDDGEKLIGLVCGAIRTLKNTRWKPDPVISMGLLYLVKIRPSIFSQHCILHALSSLLKRDQTPSFKNKGNPLVPVLVANLLIKGFHDKKDWPDIFIKIYIEDALGERIWVDNEECKGFVDNIVTAFNTRIPPKSILQPELSVMTPRDCNSPSNILEDEDSTTSLIQISSDKDKTEFPVFARYTSCMDAVENIVLEIVKEQLNRRQPETITRNFLKLLSSTCGFVEIRNIAVPKLEMWLHNPKLMRPAQELLSYICYNCTSHTQRDVEVISQLVKMRLKTKAVINLYLNGVKELIGLHAENLSTMLKHTIYNELSNARNPNNMPMIAVMFQTSPEQSAKLLAEIFQDLLMSRDDYLRPLRALLREIVRVCRHEINLAIFSRELMCPRMEIVQQLISFEFKERMFSSIVDLLCLCTFLAISPQVKEAAVLTHRGDKKDVGLLRQFQNLVSMIQYNTITWLQSSASQYYGIGKPDLLRALQKIMLLEPLEQYYKPDNFPPENERVAYFRLVSEVPLMESTLIKIIVIGMSKENGITPLEMLDLADNLIRRTAMSSSDTFPLLQIANIDIIDLIFNLCAYQPPTSINIPMNYSPPTLAISNLYWKSWIILLILSAHNPSSIGAIAWDRYPTLRVLMEMCITNHFSYPPPTMALPENIEELRSKELSFEALEKQEILQYEVYLAAGSNRAVVSEQTSLLLSQLMTMNPTGLARRPPDYVLDQIQSLNTTHRLGHLLCRSRRPDFLLDIINQRQQSSSSQSMPWLAGLVQNSEGSLSQLPVQCLCEFLLSSTGSPIEKQSKQQQLLSHLQLLLSDPLQDSQQACEVLEYFLRRLSSQSSGSRLQAITGLKLVLNTISVDEEHMDVDNETDSESWLLRKLPSIPHFMAVRSLVSKALRTACQVENNPELVQAYISYLAVHTLDDDLTELTSLVNEISQLVVERNTIVAAILPLPDNNTAKGRQTLYAFLSIYCNYLNKARSIRSNDSRVAWSENQDWILVEWATGEECTMHILAVHAMIILLTFDQLEDNELFKQLLETWFPSDYEPPKAFLVDTSEEALLIPDWLKLRIIRSNIPRLVDAALRDLDPYQLVLFIQSFGVPVNAMTKLLHLLDAAVEIDPSSVTNHVLDKTYMAQLVKILHNRGAVGGLVFLEHVQLQVQQLPDENAPLVSVQLEQLPASSKMQRLSVTHQSASVKTDIPTLINQLFIEKMSVGQKNEAYRRLHKILANDLLKTGTESDRSAIVLAIKHILSILSSIQVKEFLASLVHMSQYSCTLMRLILLPLKKPSTCPKSVELASTMCIHLITLMGDINAPILSILRDFTNMHVSKAPRQKELALLTQTRDPGSILESVDLLNLEKVGNSLLDICIKQQKNDVLVEVMAKLLISDSEQGTIKPRTGLLIDWLASMEPELIGTCPNLQIRLLFGKTNVYMRMDESIVSSHSCRPYLLTLLTHGASWATLYKCVRHLLDACHHSYDPTAVLDFLWALTCNPKLWQGREENTKNNNPDNILLLTKEQLLVLVMYLIEEAVILCERKSKKTAITQMETRLDLLISCCSSEDELIMGIVKYLADEMTSRNDTKSDMAHQFLLQLYMKLPKIINFLTTFQAKRLVNGVKISDWTGSVLDCMSHTLLTTLATNSQNRQKSWSSKSRELELCARKMAAVHPMLVLRQLPLLATALIGSYDLEYSQIRSGHHLHFFTQVMGLLELLQPHIFNEEHRKGLEDTLENYFQCFQAYRNAYCNIEDFKFLLDRFALFLQAYVTHDERNALKILQRHVRLLHDLQGFFLNLENLRSLVSGIPIPREGDRGEAMLITTAFNRNGPPPPISHEYLSQMTTALSKMQGDDVYSALQDLDTLSVRKPTVLEPILDTIANLLVSPQGNIRTISHNLVSRALKHRPYPNLTVLAGFQRCLDNPRADILMSALDRLPDYVLCMQEYALPLMQKVFELGVNSNVNTIPFINKSITLLNTQKGLS